MQEHGNEELVGRGCGVAGAGAVVAFIVAEGEAASGAAGPVVAEPGAALMREVVAR